MKKTRSAECTDLRNAERFVEKHRSELRFVSAWNKWLAWDGARWILDATGNAERAAQDTARAMLNETATEHANALKAIERAAGDEEMLEVARKRVGMVKQPLDWAVETMNATRLRAMVALAKSDASLAVATGELDRDPWLLNVTNGTVDLHTGKLRSHRREDLITKLAPIAYDAKATSPTWDAFLLRAMAGDEELVSFLRRAVGYSLTGDIREHVLFFLFGAGANGKSTFLTTLQSALGDYAAAAPRGLLFKARGGERHPTELTTLFRARFVTCSEIEDGQAFDEALVKDLTGGDAITARRMREDHWTFAPTHKLFVAGNHKPNVRGTDEGIWRRMRLIPWTVIIPAAQRDKALGEKLRAELPGIVAWAVRGCLEWQREGLGAPKAVTDATMHYREESDATGEFLDAYCAFNPDSSVPRKRIREAYEQWAKDNGHAALGARRFAERLRERGVGPATVREGTRVLDGWRGVRLLGDDEREAHARRAERRDVGTSRALHPVNVFRAGARTETNPESTLQVPTSLQRDEAAKSSEEPRETSPGTAQRALEDDESSFSSWVRDEVLA